MMPPPSRFMLRYAYLGRVHHFYCSAFNGLDAELQLRKEIEGRYFLIDIVYCGVNDNGDKKIQ